MNHRILPEAEQELFAAAAWYEDQDPGVGVRFLNAYELALELIRNRSGLSPESSSPRVTQNIQRVRIRRFPYTIVYELFSSEVVIMAVAHMRRHPDYWIARRLP